MYVKLLYYHFKGTSHINQSKETYYSSPYFLAYPFIYPYI